MTMLIVAFHNFAKTHKNYKFRPHSLFMFCIYLSKKTDYFPVQHKLMGLYNLDEECFLCVADWVFIYNSG
jgi:hypothetical protein